MHSKPNYTELNEKKDVSETIKKYIKHHLKDTHGFYLTSYTNNKNKKIYIELPLPVIIYDNGFKFWMSPKLKHGKEVINHNGDYYRLYYETNTIYKTNAQGDFIFDENGKINNIKPIDFSITKNILTIIMVSLLMLFLFGSLAKSYSKNNGMARGVGRFFEPIILYIRDDIAIPNIGAKKYKNYMSFLLTVFFSFGF